MISRSIPTISEDYADYARRRPPDREVDCSIVTTSLNSAATIERTIDSVHAQSTYVQQVFVDGGSTDGTIDRIRARMRTNDVLIAEPDRGISDAMNKGIAVAAGRAIGILHSDDWLGENQIAAALGALDRSGADFAFGDVRISVDGQPWYVERGDPNYLRVVRRRMPAVPHPSMLIRRATLERAGLYRLDLKLAMDYEWLLRSAVLGLTAIYEPAIMANMTFDGRSNTSFRKTAVEGSRIVQMFGRPRLVAELDRNLVTAKMSLGRGVRALNPSLYVSLRRLINRQIV